MTSEQPTGAEGHATHAGSPFAPATQVVALGRPDRAPGAPLAVPPVFTSTYAADGLIETLKRPADGWEWKGRVQ